MSNLFAEAYEEDEDDSAVAATETSFDPDKSLNCSVEGSHTLVHGSGGRGYGLASTPITYGCYQWKVNV